MMTNLFRIYLLFAAIIGFASCDNDGNSDKKDSGKNNFTEGQLVSVEGKKPMILLTDRPYNLETPLKYFLEDFTPNDVFFVRWHLSGLPTSVNPDTFHIRISGNVKTSLSLTLNDLKTKFKSVTLPALCACAGNARSCFKPRVAGAQWVNGGMGNAKWTGVRLRDILEMAGAKSNSKFISFNGMDAPPLPSVPDFVKTLTYDHSDDGEVMIAYEMNGQPIPLLNGYPLKLVVPGWYATYWVGMLNEVKVYADTVKAYWMDKAYQIPKGVSNGNESPDSLAKKTEPINKMDVRSIFVSPEPETVLEKGKSIEIQGLAFDGGDEITKVEISYNKGETWTEAKLDPSLGKYSWRRWRCDFKPETEGKYTLCVKATNAKGETQPWHQWNRSGYMRNEIESLEVDVK
jgi:DMSO/TMAO reductase YedYZ molybdopterin-dependent catalytic subunit